MKIVLAAVCLICLVLFGIGGAALAALVLIGVWLWRQWGQEQRELQALEDAWVRSQGEDR